MFLKPQSTFNIYSQMCFSYALVWNLIWLLFSFCNLISIFVDVQVYLGLACYVQAWWEIFNFELNLHCMIMNFWMSRKWLRKLRFTGPFVHKINLNSSKDYYFYFTWLINYMQKVLVGSNFLMEISVETCFVPNQK